MTYTLFVVIVLRVVVIGESGLVSYHEPHPIMAACEAKAKRINDAFIERLFSSGVQGRISTLCVPDVVRQA